MGKKLYFDLEKYFDLPALEKEHLNICLGLAKASANSSTRTIPHFEMQNNIAELVKFKKSENPRVMQILNEGISQLSFAEKRLITALSYEQQKRFLQFYKKAYNDGEYVRIKYPRREHWKDQSSIFYSDRCDYTENIEHFSSLLKYIEKLPFLEIGRIIIFVTYQYMHSDVHYDRSNEVYNGHHHYIWLNPFKQKKFFILDEHQNKNYVESKAAIFDGTYLHGVEPAPHHTYSIRIDGQFTKEFCDNVGLPWKERPSAVS